MSAALGFPTIPVNAVTEDQKGSRVAAGPARESAIVLEEISSTGSAMGRTEENSEGRITTFLVASTSTAVSAAGGCTGVRRSDHPANTNPAEAAGTATSNPTSIIVPRSTPSAVATARGPGVGGTSVCVAAAPPAIAITYLRYCRPVRPYIERASGTR